MRKEQSEWGKKKRLSPLVFVAMLIKRERETGNSLSLWETDRQPMTGVDVSEVELNSEGQWDTGCGVFAPP